ncbi:22179_t:CDS:2 [Gigaspora rosea]|nr:22179_t:CDS:2 [Gigaspora rosea]
MTTSAKRQALKIQAKINEEMRKMADRQSELIAQIEQPPKYN